jgi:fatty-acyl-CoA synthase
MTLTRNVFGLLDRSAESHYGGAQALSIGGEARSFAALRDRALRVARGLARQGIGPGDRVAVMLSNRHEWPEVFFGIAALGALCVPINVLLTAREITHVCEDSSARCLIMDEPATATIAMLDQLPELVIVVGEAQPPEGSARTVGYEDLIAEAQGPVATGGPDLTDDFILYYSSGTTGLPKAAVHTHSSVLWNSFGQIPDLRLNADVVYLLVPSLSWAAGFHNLFLALAWIGGRSVIMPSGAVKPDLLMDAIERSSVTHVMLIPSLLRQFVADPALLERMRSSSLRWVVTGAEPVPRALIETINEELPECKVCQGYGLSEFPTIATLLRPEEALEHHGSAGRPLLHTQVAVQNDAGAIAPDGTGELLIRSPATMRCYHNRPEQTAAALADGWLHTGDLASIDEAGFVSIVGRTKDMIISGALNVYPKEIEDVLSRLPGVLESAVVGVPDERFGERPVAIIVRSAGVEVDAGLVERTCRAELAAYKCPRSVLLRDEPLPRTPTGKILKRVLRPWAAAQLGLAAPLDEALAPEVS